jgi:hypothetical protein
MSAPTTQRGDGEVAGALDVIRARHAAATPGPWRWFGRGGRRHKQVDVYLATVDRGRIYVMDFVRSGMSGAQPRFQPAGEGMVPAKDLVTYHVDYRDDISGIANPDAEAIEHSWSDVETLLRLVDQQAAELTEVRRQLDEARP